MTYGLTMPPRGYWVDMESQPLTAHWKMRTGSAHQICPFPRNVPDPPSADTSLVGVPPQPPTAQVLIEPVPSLFRQTTMLPSVRRPSGDSWFAAITAGAP